MSRSLKPDIVAVTASSMQSVACLPRTQPIRLAQSNSNNITAGPTWDDGPNNTGAPPLRGCSSSLSSRTTGPSHRDPPRADRGSGLVPATFRARLGAYLWRSQCRREAEGLAAFAIGRVRRQIKPCLRKFSSTLPSCWYSIAWLTCWCRSRRLPGRPPLVPHPAAIRGGTRRRSHPARRAP
jgi:hypothetical protein